MVGWTKPLCFFYFVKVFPRYFQTLDSCWNHNFLEPFHIMLLLYWINLHWWVMVRDVGSPFWVAAPNSFVGDLRARSIQWKRQTHRKVKKTYQKKLFQTKNHNQRLQKPHHNKTALDSAKLAIFLSFLAFPICSIAQNQNPKHRKYLNPPCLPSSQRLYQNMTNKRLQEFEFHINPKIVSYPDDKHTLLFLQNFWRCDYMFRKDNGWSFYVVW